MSDGAAGMNYQELLKRAYLTVEKLQARVNRYETASKEPVAVIGMGCRFPGGADTPEAYWRLLREGVDTVAEIPRDRWNLEEHYDPDPSVTGKMYTRWASMLSEVDRFDAAFFGISPREALSMDPQQRLLLEVTWEALEDAAQAPDRLAGSATGVFIGISNCDYGQRMNEPSRIDAYTSTGVGLSVAAGRLSYVLGLQGPSLAVDTACSSSLVAVHLACQSLRAGESRMAIAGGSNLILSPLSTIAVSALRMMALDGRCKTFDARADGFVRGEGCGVVVLKRLVDAERDGDRVLAVIRGWAANQDGRSGGLTAPNGPAQQALLRQALASGGVAPAAIDYVEAHGTGTSLGDPIEVQALGAVLGEGREAGQPLLLGSVKTNIGHLEAAAGVAGLIKTVLALQHGEIPPHLHLKQVNPLLDLARIPARIPTQREPWPARGGPRRAAVSSFGFSGTNAHVVLEQAPEAASAAPSAPERPRHLLALSAQTEGALKELAGRYAACLAAPEAPALADAGFTAHTGRSHFPSRLALTAATGTEAATQLAAWRAGEATAAVLAGRAGEPEAVAFLYPGQGSQYAGMGLALYETQPVFRAALDRCAALLDPELGVPLLEVLRDGDRLGRTEFTQPALFAVEVALTELWRSWGITPGYVLGHSVGEYAAAVAAGVFSLEDGARLIAARGRLLGALPAGGAMAAVFADEARVRAALNGTGDVSLAAVNGPGQVTISGAEAAVAATLQKLAVQGIKSTPLAVSHAFHSALIEPALAEFARVAATVTYHPPAVPFVAGATGTLTANASTPEYWVRQTREAVQFAAGLGTLQAQGATAYVEVGPGSTLVGLGRRAAAEGSEAAWLPSLREGREWETLLGALGSLYVRGAAVDWAGYDRGYARRKVSLPTYPFQRQRYWLPMPESRPARSLGPGAELHPLLGSRLRGAVPTFEARFGLERFPYLADHRVQGRVVLPASAFLEMALASALVEGIEPAEVAALTIDQPLVLADEGDRTVQAVVARDAGGERRFQLFSEADDGTWTLHAEAHLQSPAERGTEGASLDAARQRCNREIDVPEYYRRLAERGFQYGPAFQGIAQLWRGEREAVGRIVLPAPAKTGGTYAIHPALLDACFQLIGAALDDEAAEGEHGYLLARIESFRSFGPAGTEAWAHLAVRDDLQATAAGLTADLCVYDLNGVPVARAAGLCIRRISPALPGQVNTPPADWFYQVEWEPRPLAVSAAESLAAPAEIARRVDALAPALAREHRLSEYGDFLRELELLSVQYVSAALDELGWDLQPGERVEAASLAERLGVVPAHRRLFGRLLEMLAEEGTLLPGADGWTARQRLEPAAPQRLQARLAAQYPAGAAELDVLSRCGARLADVLRGACDPLQLLFPGGSAADLERLYRDSPGSRVFNTLVGEAVAGALARLPAERKVRLLEIGAGTGGTTAFVLDHLPAERTEYVFTDVSPLFTTKAAQTFGGYPFVEYGLLDIERDPAGQGYPAESFDIILAANVLHATPKLRETLAHARSLLAPGGLLVLLEGTGKQRWLDLIFGLTEGWWKFADTDLRPSHPLLDRARWEALLADAGFEDVTSLPDEAALGSQQSVLLARAPAAPAQVEGATPWLIFADRSGVGDGLAELIAARGEACVRVRTGDEYARQATDAYTIDPYRSEAYERLVHDVLAGGCRGVVHLWSLDATPEQPFDEAQLLACGSALQWLQAGTSAPPTPLWLVTRGAVPLPANAAVAPEQAPLWGLGRVIALEYPERWGGLVDLDPGCPAEEQARSLLAQLSCVDGEDQVAFRAEERHVPRLARTRPPADGTLTIRPEAAYLVTGGLGPVGLAVAEGLVAAGARSLVLTGRSGLPERATWDVADPASAVGKRIAAVWALEARGAAVRVAAVDVTDRPAMAALIDGLGVPLAGVIHAANDLSIARLEEMTDAALLAMLRPKALGAWVLHEVTRHLDLDFFVLCSSTTGLWGSQGLGHYAAANQFLDVLAHHRRRLGLPALSINWGTWASGERDSLAQYGLQPMNPDLAVAAMERLIAAAATQAAVAAVDWSVLKPVYEARRRRPFLERVDAAPSGTPVGGTADADFLRTLEGADPARRHEQVVAYVQEQVARVLGFDGAAAIDPQQGFFQAGMDSLTSVELKSRLEAGLGCTLPTTLAFEYSTVEALAGYLEAEVLPAPAVPVPESPIASEAANDGLEQLSKQELLELLAQELSGAG
jgi:acyl transferase domain-containing protein/acyl carrier protein/protein-L-isoaspartate O-methyltransferase